MSLSHHHRQECPETLRGTVQLRCLLWKTWWTHCWRGSHFEHQKHGVCMFVLLFHICIQQMYKYIYIYIYVCVCICVYMYICFHEGSRIGGFWAWKPGRSLSVQVLGWGLRPLWTSSWRWAQASRLGQKQPISTFKRQLLTHQIGWGMLQVEKFAYHWVNFILSLVSNENL